MRTKGKWVVEMETEHSGGSIFAVKADGTREYIGTTSGNAKANAEFICKIANEHYVEWLEAENARLKEQISLYDQSESRTVARLKKDMAEEIRISIKINNEKLAVIAQLREAFTKILSYTKMGTGSIRKIREICIDALPPKQALESEDNNA